MFLHARFSGTMDTRVPVVRSVRVSRTAKPARDRQERNGPAAHPRPFSISARARPVAIKIGDIGIHRRERYSCTPHAQLLVKNGASRKPRLVGSRISGHGVVGQFRLAPFGQTVLAQTMVPGFCVRLSIRRASGAGHQCATDLSNA